LTNSLKYQNKLAKTVFIYSFLIQGTSDAFTLFANRVYRQINYLLVWCWIWMHSWRTGETFDVSLQNNFPSLKLTAGPSLECLDAVNAFRIQNVNSWWRR